MINQEFIEGNKDPIIKTIIVLGEHEVGKTSLMQMLSKHYFETVYQTTYGVDYYNKQYDNNNTTLSLWDTSGSEINGKLLPKQIYKRANCFIIVLSYDNIRSFQIIEQYINFIKDNKSQSNALDNILIPIIVLINKSDIKNKQFSFEDVNKKLENEFSVMIIDEISVKNQELITSYFQEIVLYLNGKRIKTKSLISDKKSREKRAMSFQLNNPPNQQKKQCCK